MNKNIKLVKTEAGDFTLYNKELDEHFHSTKGAIDEALHVYIKNGLHKIDKKEINILEIGFGTGLNAFLTFIEATKLDLQINYTSIEKYLLPETITKQLNYIDFYSEYEIIWNKIQKQENFKIENFNFSLIEGDLSEIEFSGKFDLVYYDAFAPDKQPEMWTLDNLSKVCNCLSENGILTTYTAKGLVKQRLRKLGLTVKRLAGALGKRHMINAQKLVNSE